MAKVVLTAHRRRLAAAAPLGVAGATVLDDQRRLGLATGGLWVSANAGGAWRLVSARLPPIACVRFAA